jgi:hypothetical protein
MLTDALVRGARGTDRPRKLTDGRGLHLLVGPNGGRYWRYSYRYKGKQKTLALGVYPDVSLAKTRERHLAARQLLVDGVDPSAEKQTVGRRSRKSRASGMRTGWRTDTNGMRITFSRAWRPTSFLKSARFRCPKFLGRLKEVSFDRDLVFPGDVKPDQPMSNNTLLFALYRMGYRGRMTGHGFRGVASTILHEQGWPHEHIEIQLAHQERDDVRAAYNHALYLKPRAEMMQAWADHLDTLRRQQEERLQQRAA